jgi:hypothetical protein
MKFKVGDKVVDEDRKNIGIIERLIPPHHYIVKLDGSQYGTLYWQGYLKALAPKIKRYKISYWK